jgi:hypothetical protein
VARLYGLTGKKRVGKDTAGQALVECGYVRAAFADALKMMLATFLSIRGASDQEIAAMIEGQLKEAPTDYLFGATPRHAMQTLGTEWGRNCINQDLWVLTLKEAIEAALAQGASVVVTDVRFNNEAKVIRDLGGTVVHLTRPNYVTIDLHASEAGVLFLPGDVNLENRYHTAAEFKNMVKYTLGVPAHE